MSIRNAETYLRAWRKDQPNDPLIEKAFRAVGEDAELKRRLEEQAAFDGQMTRALHAIASPAGLRQRVCGNVEATGKGRPPFAMATYFAAFCGLATIVALLVLFALDRRGAFPGSEAVTRIVVSANSMSGVELEPVSNKAGDLGDWFYVRGYDSYALPGELANAPAVGSRLFKQDGTTIAQVAVDWHHAIFYLFRADAFGVEVPPGRWQPFQAENWQAVLRRDGNNCTVVAIRGDHQEMESLLHALESK